MSNLTLPGPRLGICPLLWNLAWWTEPYSSKTRDRRAGWSAGLPGRAVRPDSPFVILSPGLPGRAARPARSPGSRLQCILNHLTSYWRHYCVIYCKNESNKFEQEFSISDNSGTIIQGHRLLLQSKAIWLPVSAQLSPKFYLVPFQRYSIAKSKTNPP